MTNVTFTLISEPEPVVVDGKPRDGLASLFGGFECLHREKSPKQIVVTLAEDLSDSEQDSLQASLEASGHCADVTF